MNEIFKARNIFLFVIHLVYILSCGFITACANAISEFLFIKMSLEKNISSFQLMFQFFVGFLGNHFERFFFTIIIFSYVPLVVHHKFSNSKNNDYLFTSFVGMLFLVSGFIVSVTQAVLSW